MTPWPTENPNDGPLWVKWNTVPFSAARRHALVFGDFVISVLTDAEAEAVARQLGQPIPRQTEMVRIDQLKGRVLAEWPDDGPCTGYAGIEADGSCTAAVNFAYRRITVTDDLMVEVLK